MKEERFFYVPDVAAGELPKEEANHAVRVLRLRDGDDLHLMDGKGVFYEAKITVASNHRCAFTVLNARLQERAWRGHIHLAVAPTKLNDRMEWMAEKATEIGFDELSFLDCQFSERRVIKTERIEKIVVAAMKQSHKAWLPLVNDMQSFASFVKSPRKGDKFICHCYAQADVEDVAAGGEETKPYLLDVLRTGEDCTVMIGPEGDFSIEEVRLALANGWQSVSLGRSRLRTETAALAAVHLMHIKNQLL